MVKRGDACRGLLLLRYLVGLLIHPDVVPGTAEKTHDAAEVSSSLDSAQ
jgi:hypothetical protein